MNAQNIFSPDAFLSKMWNIFSLSLNVRPVFRAIMTDFLIFRHIFYAVRREFLRKPKNLWASFFLTHCFVWRASDTILALLWKSNAFFEQKYISSVKMFHVKQFYIFLDSAAKKRNALLFPKCFTWNILKKSSLKFLILIKILLPFFPIFRHILRSRTATKRTHDHFFASRIEIKAGLFCHGLTPKKALFQRKQYL